MAATRADLLRTPGVREFLDSTAPDGASPYVDGARPGFVVSVVPADPRWPRQAATVMAGVRAALGTTIVSLEHVGSTSVPGLAAKPVLDLDLLVTDPDDEASYVPALEDAGFQLIVREPWWYGHRMFRGADPAVNLHVYGPDSAESARQRLFRDWLRGHPDDREAYAAAKRAAALASAAAGEHVQQYNRRKETALRAVYARMFADAAFGAAERGADVTP